MDMIVILDIFLYLSYGSSIPEKKASPAKKEASNIV
jgi:hypothetical protein